MAESGEYLLRVVSIHSRFVGSWHRASWTSADGQLVRRGRHSCRRGSKMNRSSYRRFIRIDAGPSNHWKEI
jgi:hypothetical protein